MSGQQDDGRPVTRPSDVAMSPQIPVYRSEAQQGATLPLSSANTADNSELEHVAQAAATAARRRVTGNGPPAVVYDAERASGQSRGLAQWTSMKSRMGGEDANKAEMDIKDRNTAQNYFQIRQNLRVSEKVKEQLHMFDEDGDGVLNATEVANLVEHMMEEQSQRKMYQYASIALVVFTIVLLASIFGLTWAVVAALKDTKVTNEILVTKAGDPVQTASRDYVLNSAGLLQPRNMSTQATATAADVNPAVRTGGYVGVSGDLNSNLDLNTLLEMNVFHVVDSANHEIALRVMGVLRSPNVYNPDVITVTIITFSGNLTIEGTTIVNMSPGVEAAFLQAGFTLSTGLGRRLLADYSTRGFFNAYKAAPSSAPDTPSPAVPDRNWRAAGNDKTSAFWQAREHGLGFDDAGNEDPDTLRNMWIDWCQNYPNLANVGDQTAYRNFVRNMREVRRVNLDLSLPYWASGNAFSHMSFEQFAAGYMGAQNPNTRGRRSALEEGPIYNGDNLHLFPEAHAAAMSAQEDLASSGGSHKRKVLGRVKTAPTPSPRPPSPPPAPRLACPSPCNIKNWVADGKVTPIRNQGGCGSCWAFAATAGLESMYLMANMGSVSTLDMSEQQLVSCAPGFGCSGGWLDQGLNYYFNTPIVRESNWPYTTSNGTCNTALFQPVTSGNAIQTATQATYIQPSNSESTLINAVLQSPVPFLMMCDYSFQVYAGGIYKSSTCTTGVNHAMMLVGYEWDSVTGQFYWRIKNSWGTGWGEGGYMRAAMTGIDGPGMCGMYQYAYSPASTFVAGAMVN